MTGPQPVQQSGSAPETLKEVLITRQLAFRRLPAPRSGQEVSSLKQLADCFRAPEGVILQKFTDLTLEVCDAGSAGVSLLETSDSGEEIFCWAALSGGLAPCAGFTTSRYASASGACLDEGGPILLDRPARAFLYLDEIRIPIVEGLVLPLYDGNGRALGTVWVVFHDERRQFDGEDLRLMESLTQLLSTGLETARKIRAAEAKSRMMRVGAAVALALTRRDTLRTMLQGCAQSIVDYLDATFARIWTVSPGGLELVLQASAGLYTHLDGPHSRVPVGTLKIGRIAAERKPHLTNDVLSDPQVSDPEWARQQAHGRFRRLSADRERGTGGGNGVLCPSPA